MGCSTGNKLASKREIGEKFNGSVKLNDRSDRARRLIVKPQEEVVKRRFDRERDEDVMLKGNNESASWLEVIFVVEVESERRQRCYNPARRVGAARKGAN